MREDEKMKKRIIAWLLSVAIAVGLVPTAAVTAFATGLSETEAVTVLDEYISVSVSKKNGGFTIKTVEGDRLKKSDNNKDLLYHDGQFDTSFLSFRVGEGTNAKDYIFGGNYAGSGDVSVTKSPAGNAVSAEWTVDGLTVTQNVSLSNHESNESGMVSISVDVKNTKGISVPVKARLLLDTSLGSRDYGIYRYMDKTNNPVVVDQERVVEGDENIPTQLYAADDAYSPTVMAYSIHTGTKPNKIAFGHWSRLAATLFDFTPSTNLNFTVNTNEYYTADSAYALYFDLGTVANGKNATLSTHYGVFSNHKTPAENSVAVNVTAPMRLELNDKKTDFVPKSNVGNADFSVSVDFTNIETENARDLDNIVLTVRSGRNLRSLDDDGLAATGQDYTTTEPYTFPYTDFTVGSTKQKTLFFEAKPDTVAHYEMITIGVYDISSMNGQISDTYKLGERVVYILLPGGDGDVPQVNFAAMTPKIIYSEGTRHLFVTVTNESMLSNTGNWSLKAYTEDGKKGIDIPHTNISIKDGVMDVALTEDMKLDEGGWYLQLEWADSVVGEGESYIVPTALAKQTAPELHFTVSNDKKYKNDSYGVLAVVELEGYSTSKDKKFYRIYTFADEADFEAYKADPVNYGNGKYEKYTEIILKIKGEFTATKKTGTHDGSLGTYYTAVSTKTITDGKTEIDNPIVINDCMDFEDGTMTVYYEDYDKAEPLNSAVCTEFDGKLYTNGARTGIWTGRAAFTKLEQGENDYSLIPYDENGERISLIDSGNGKYKAGDPEGFNDEAIYLMWPSVGAVGQTLSGLLFKLAYGQLGRMYDTNATDKSIESEIGTVVSFAAALDLTFASNYAAGNGDAPDTYWSKIQEVWAVYRDKDAPYVFADDFDAAIKSMDWSQIDESGKDPTKSEAKASAMVRDVLFGCGKGFVGVNFTVGVAITNYVTALPEIVGTLSVNTVNNWSYGLTGKIDLEAFCVEAEVSFRSRNDVPVPDNFYVFVSGFEPGINIDGMGVCWITGGGGGIKNLYDSIFATKTVPPLKLLLSVSFDIIKVLECEKATLSLGLTGVSVSAEDIGIKALPGVTAIKKMGLSLEWYPGIDLRANIVVDLFDSLIYGGGYIVLLSPDYKDVFFEMFARARLNVPNSIPIVGGMTVGGVDLGINSDKIWGAVDVLFITLGLTYYWGESGVDFSSGSKTEPTFPELLGYKDIPVGYDAETDRMLYARIGTNTSLMATSLPDDGTLKLMAGGTAVLGCLNAELKNSYKFNLGTHTGSDAIVQITYDAADEADAKAKANNVKVGTSSGTNDFGIVLYDRTKSEAENANANANVTYNETTGKATFAFTVTDSAKYGRDWYLSLPEGSDVMLYNVAEVPEVKTVSGTVSGNDITLNWTGSELSELDQISFFLCESNDAGSAETENSSIDPGRRIGVVEDSATLAGGSTTISVPVDVPSGSYYIRAVYSKSDEVNGAVYSTSRVNFVNSNTPSTVSISNPHAAGDLKFELTLNNGENTDGYLVTVYKADGKTVTDFEQVSFDKNENGETVISVGGKYTAGDPNDSTTTQEFGLVGGESYVIGVTPYNEVVTPSIAGGAEGKIAVRGAEVKTSVMQLPVPQTPQVVFAADKTAQTRVVREMRNNGSGTVEPVNVNKTVYTDNTLCFTASVSEAVSGSWKINDGAETSFENTSTIQIPIDAIADGEHTITVTGNAADGDGFAVTYAFTVDTMPPQLLLAAPVNGSFFGKDGKVKVSGVTDADARFKVLSDGAIICDGKTAAELATISGGSFNSTSGEFDLTLEIPDPDSMSARTLSISVSDDVGNATSPANVTVSHGGLADLKSLEVMVNGQTFSNGNVPIPTTGINSAPLTLVGSMSDGTKFNLTGYNVGWDILTVDGTANIDNGSFTAAAMSQGMITGRLAVATNAFRTASLSFGALSGHTVAIASTIGGTVSGGGDYEPGATVTLTAVPDSGYRFDGWMIAGADVSGIDMTATSISFTMPQNGNVSVDAKFAAVAPSTAPSGGSSATRVDGCAAKAGETISILLPSGKLERDYLPYYYNVAGEKVFVPMSAVSNGYVRFVAPVTAQYYFGANNVSFADIDGRWSEDNILFAASREIFKGVGNELFAPEEAMSRAMVITVLYRLAGSPTVGGECAYSDVDKNDWYTDAVLWGDASGIIRGYGNGLFGVNDLITREQLCTMIMRFVEYMGYELSENNADTNFADAGSISEWAAEAVDYCAVRGLVNGVEKGIFAPTENSTREQCCAIMERMIRGLLAKKK